MILSDELILRVRRALHPDYEVVRELGRGGMGVVYLARERALDRDVAVKILPPVLEADPLYALRFVREARAAARLDHPHIVPIYQVREYDGMQVLVMKYVNGASLESWLRSLGALPFEDVRRILRAAAEALAHAHGIGVVHRDVKPGNILLDESGWVYVADFGLAKAVTEETPAERSGARLGTPAYTAPELWDGVPADALSDQYSLGVVGFRMLCGRLPFEGESIEELCLRRWAEDPPSVQSLRPDVPKDLEIAVERTLRRERAERFADLAEMAQLLGAGGMRSRGYPRTVPAPLTELEPTTVPLAAPGAVHRIVHGVLTAAVAVVIAAAGSLWALGRPVPPTGLWPLVRVPSREVAVERPVQRIPERPRKPPVPEATVDRIRERLAWGRVWFEIGRYEDALAEYRQGLADAEEAAAEFKTAGAVDSLRIALQGAIEETRRACAQTAEQNCLAGP